MAKLYFRYGTVGSAKTLNLLAVTHNYKQQGKDVFLIKPEIDVRFGKKNIKSRAGLEMTADMLIDDHTKLNIEDFQGINCVLVDEAQFLSRSFVDQLRELTLSQDIPVICYGLRTNFKSQLFEGTKRLMEIADSIEEIKSTCFFCNRKAILNLKHINGRATVRGETIELGAEELYFPTCYSCYMRSLKEAGELEFLEVDRS